MVDDDSWCVHHRNKPACRTTLQAGGIVERATARPGQSNSPTRQPCPPTSGKQMLGCGLRVFNPTAGSSGPPRNSKIVKLRSWRACGYPLLGRLGFAE
jgi:hypothetical protein